ncbi:transcriptional regulator swi6 [Lunasporangiospora selenospora]|uniref:Transcriptional regulator swi6 n=1 Tax=Lunasporangiospora selenospora TaxID=979761 RepID=A0A9P6FXW3_9FUNG|nr:transcriptional regulator swi6 [Lunasporangiospora selenospora]
MSIYTAIYSGVPVFELMCRGIAVMRRREDSYLNATQILKVAGIEKGRRTKILEREVLTGDHEKVQGGYGKYQGTWVPFIRGKDLAKQYKVEPYLRPLFDYDIYREDVDASPQWHADPPPRKKVKAASSPPPPQPFDSDFTQDGDMAEYEQGDLLRPEPIPDPVPEEPLEGAEKYRAILMAIFLNDETEELPSLLTEPSVPNDMDIDLVIDDQGHTALHWAAALARIQVLELLVQKHTDIRRVNYNGESALIRAVLVTNNFDKQTFPHLLNILHKAMPIVDNKNRTVLHHIAITAGIRGRGSASHYYMECLMEWIARNGGDFSSIIDIQDKNGDTALTIAARIGDRYLSKFLIDVGANRDIENKVGLKADDFGVEEVEAGLSEQPYIQRSFTATANADASAKELQSSKRGKEIMSVVQKMVDELDVEFTQEIVSRQGQLQDTQEQLRRATRELTDTRRGIKQFRDQAQHLAEAHQKIKNLEQALEEESQKTRQQKGYTSKLRSSNNDIDNLLDVKKQSAASQGDSGSNLTTTLPEFDPVTREKVAEQELIQLRSRVHAYQKNDEELSQELLEMRGKSSAKELQCKKVIAICCNIPLEKVDELLVPLTLAVESDGASLDLTRVAGFMSRVKQQEGMALASSTTGAPTSSGTTTNNNAE